MAEIDNSEFLFKKFSPLIETLTHDELVFLNKMIIERVRLINKAGTLMSMAQFHVGDRVQWTGSDGIQRIGVIARINHKTGSVKINEGYWNISPQL
jgi:hypothetical protein